MGRVGRIGGRIIFSGKFFFFFLKVFKEHSEDKEEQGAGDADDPGGDIDVKKNKNADGNQDGCDHGAGDTKNFKHTDSFPQKAVSYISEPEGHRYYSKKRLAMQTISGKGEKSGKKKPIKERGKIQ